MINSQGQLCCDAIVDALIAEDKAWERVKSYINTAESTMLMYDHDHAVILNRNQLRISISLVNHQTMILRIFSVGKEGSFLSPLDGSRYDIEQDSEVRRLIININHVKKTWIKLLAERVAALNMMPVL